MLAQKELTRRSFLAASAAVGGGLLIGFAWPNSRQTLAVGEGRAPFNSWIQIRPDNTVTLMVGASEMGQGIDTALPMLLAEELEADWKLVTMKLADAHPAFNNPILRNQTTGGSLSIRAYSEPLRRAGATARVLLIAAASKAWNVAAAECRAEASRVIHTPSGRQATFGELADTAAHLDAPDAALLSTVALKKPSEWKLAGKPVKRLDTFAKATGRAGFGIDVQVPGMLVASLAMCPAFGGKLVSVDSGAALGVKGVKAVVPLTGVARSFDDCVAVVADGYWAARKGVAALKVSWDLGSNGNETDASLLATYRAGLEEAGATAENLGNAVDAFAGAAKKVDAVFEFPYLAHATMEPMNATARMTADGVEIWAPSQSPGGARDAVARQLGLKPEQVTVHQTFLGGGFGRRGEHDYVLQAVLIAKAVKAPVKVLWSREDDMRHDVYRPATVVRVQAGLDASDKPIALHTKTVNSSIWARRAPQLLKGGLDMIITPQKVVADAGSVEGFYETQYGFPARRVDHVMKNLLVPVSPWRSVANSYSAFCMETVLDELAALAGQDPVKFRLELLKAKPRHAAVLSQVAQMAGWGTTLPTGRARGVALHPSYGSIVGQVAEVSLRGQEYRVHRVWCAVDCGIAINPDTVMAQMHSGIVYGLTAAQFGEINIEAGGVKQANFPDYQMVKLAQMPDIDVHVMQNEFPHGGIGEPGTPPIAPAIANALFTLSGKRVRTLPFGKHGFTLA